MSASFTLDSSPQLQAGEAVNLYRANNLGGTVIAAAVLDANGQTRFSGLSWDTEYVIRGARDVRFRTPPDPREQPVLGSRFDDEATIVVYASPDGIGTGLSEDDPLELQAALDYVATYGPVLAGLWTVELAAGTYPNAPYQLNDALMSRQRVQIKGPDVSHPTAPTAIIDAAGAGHGLIVGLRTYVRVEDLKAINFSTADSSTASGFLAESGANVHWVNCHYQGSTGYAGIYNDGCEFARVSGGVASGTQTYGRLYYNCNVATDGYGSASTADSPQTPAGTVTTAAILVQGSYVDGFNLLIDGVPVGVRCTARGRFRAEGSTFRNCTTAAAQGQGAGCELGIYGQSPANTLTGNTKDVDVTGGAIETSLHASSAAVARRQHYDTAAASLTGTTTRTSMKTGILAAILGNVETYKHLIGKTIKVRVLGTFTGTAGTKTVEFALLSSGYAPLTFPATENGSWELEVDLLLTQAAVQIVHARGVASVAGGAATPTLRKDRQQRTITLDGSQSGRIYGTPGNAADTITIESVEAWVA
jgi:hypothetical protein